jgi:hypothetical protein
MPRNDDLQARLAALPYAERCSLLVMSVIERNPNALATSLAMLDLLMRLSSDLGEENRRKLSERLRVAADHLEGCVRPVGDVQRVIH